MSIKKISFLAPILIGIASFISLGTLQAKSCHQVTPFTVEFQLLDSGGSPIADSEFEIETLLVDTGDTLTIQFPLFNFQTEGSGGFVQSINLLPKEYRPLANQPFIICSNNDAFLQLFSTLGPFPNPLSSFTLAVSSSGVLEISNASLPIAAGGHTFNSQSVSYPKMNSGCSSSISYAANPFTLQLLDYQNFALPGTSFSINSTVGQQENLVQVELSPISFTITGATSPVNQIPFPLIIGGYVGTVSGSLPENLRPTQIQTVFDPVSGLNLSIDTYGFLNIASPSNVEGVIPVGTYTTGSVVIKYHQPEQTSVQVQNFIIQPGFTNFVNSTNAGALTTGIRNFQVNDNYCDVLAWSWADNSAQTDQTNNTMDAYVAIGNVVDDKVKVGVPTRLTQYPPNEKVTSTSVAINRKNRDNIVVSFHTINYNLSTNRNTLIAYVSQNGGKSWSSPVNVDPALTTVGSTQLISDKYGNFWMIALLGGSTNVGIYLSSDGGFNWNQVFTTTDGPTYDYAHVAVGNNGDGQYGLWFAAEYFNPNIDIIPLLGFIPATGRGKIGNPNYIDMENFLNGTGLNALAVKADGTVFINSCLGEYQFLNNYYANTLLTKFPGPLSQNLISQPQTILNSGQNILPTASYPVFAQSYFPTTINNSFYDEKRKALYMVYAEQPDPASQDLYLFMVVSFNDGISWSKKVQLASSHTNNRGFSSIAFDQSTGTMSIGFYDSRNSPDSTSEQYFGGYISKKELDKIVKHLRKSSL